MLVFFVMQWITDVLAVYPYLDLSPDLAYHGSWVQLSDHHLWQLLLAVLLIVCFAGKHWPTWGLNLTNLSLSLRIVWQFGLVFSLYLIILQLFAHRGGEIPTLSYPLTATNILGWLGFQVSSCS